MVSCCTAMVGSPVQSTWNRSCRPRASGEVQPRYSVTITRSRVPHVSGEGQGIFVSNVPRSHDCNDCSQRCVLRQLTRSWRYGEKRQHAIVFCHRLCLRAIRWGGLFFAEFGAPVRDWHDPRRRQSGVAARKIQASQGSPFSCVAGLYKVTGCLFRVRPLP